MAMFKNYFKTAIRNFRHNKIFALINNQEVQYANFSILKINPQSSFSSLKKAIDCDKFYPDIFVKGK